MTPPLRRLVAVLAGAAITGALVVGLSLLARVEPPEPGPRDRHPVRLARIDESAPPEPLPEREPPPPPPPAPAPEIVPDPVAPRAPAPDIELPPLRLDTLPIGPGPSPQGFVFEAGDLDQQPRVTFRVDPEYPFRAERRGVTGTVDVTMLVRRDGTVGEVRITGAEPTGIFEDAVRAAVKQWRFEPGRIDGEPVTAWVRTTVLFEAPGR